MKVIGITGGVGAGKSTVLEYLKRTWNAYVIQADKVGHRVMEPGERCYEEIVQLFGKQIIKNDKTIDRKQVSDVVFNNEEMLLKLNGIVHPAVKQKILDTIAEQKSKNRSLVVVEAALLLEERYQDFCDAVWYIHTEEEIRIQRLMDSRGYTREKARSIMANQASEAFFRTHADLVVENNGDSEKTYQQIDEGVRKI